MVYFGLSGAKTQLRGLPPRSKRLVSFASVQWCLHASYEDDSDNSRSNPQELFPSLALCEYFQGNTRCDSAFGVLKTDLEGCHNEIRGWFLLQMSDGAFAQRATLISRVQEAIRMRYFRFEHFVSPLKSIHGVLWPFRC